MSAAALAAQEAARQNNGRFGSHLHGEMSGGTGVLGAPVNLAKESEQVAAPQGDWQAPVGPVEIGFQGDVLAPGHIPRVMVSGRRSVFEYQGGKVTMPELEDIQKVQRDSGGVELVVPVRHEDRYGRSAEREVTVKKHGAGYTLTLPTGKEYSDDEHAFLTAAASAIAWTCPPEPVEPENAHRTANLAGLSAKHWLTDTGILVGPQTRDQAEFERQHKERMRRWKENENFRGRMQRAREAAEDSYKPPGFFASLGMALRR